MNFRQFILHSLLVSIGTLIMGVFGQSVTVYTLAGTGGYGSTDGPASSARFNNPLGAVVDADFNVYIADEYNNAIRLITPAGQVSKFASSPMSRPQGITIDVSGNFYVTDTASKVYKINPSAVVVLLAGSDAGFADGQGTNAKFSSPQGIDVDSSGNVYVADNGNHRIRKITAEGLVSTLIGTGATTNINGPATSATLSQPTGVVVDSAGSVIFSSYNSMLIRKLSGGVVTTLAGGATGFANGQGTNAKFSSPNGLSADSLDNIYVADYSNYRVRKITPTGFVTTVAGTGAPGAVNGAGTIATFSLVQDVAVDRMFNLYIPDLANYLIRKIVVCNSLSTRDAATLTCVCPAGYYQLYNGSCVICPAGQIANSSITACQTCPSGQYRGSNMVVCKDCWPGVPNSDSSNCVCPVPFSCPAFAACSSSAITACSVGYKISINGTICEQCPVGTQSSGDSLSCVSCTAGTNYRSSLTQSTCVACPLNSACTAIGFTCNAGYEPTGDVLGCQLCGEGYTKAAAGNTACAQCAIGTESAANKQSCTACGSGKYRPLTSFNKCVPCPANGACTATVLTCNAGYKLNAAGDGCDQCPIGQQSNAGLTACVACTAGTNYRSSLTQTACIACPTSAACTATGFTCNAGYEPTGEGLGCSQCLDGYSKSATGNTACTQCAIGTESAANRQSCANCAAGYYRSSLANARCIPCPTGATCSTSAITRCANGYKINANAVGCEQCPIGQDSSNGITCVGCNAGYFKPDQSYQMCTRCPDGSPSCGGTLVTCQTGYFFDSNVQCKRNDTYFALMQTGTASASTVTAFVTVTQTTTSTTTSTSVTTETSTSVSISVSITTSSTSIFATITVPAETISASVTVANNAAAAAVFNTQTVTINNQNLAVTQTVTVLDNINSVSTVTMTNTVDGPAAGSEQQSQNSITLDSIGTLQISPLMFGAACLGVGLVLASVLSLICCRRRQTSKAKLDEFDGPAMTSTMNTTSQRTFNNNTTLR